MSTSKKQGASENTSKEVSSLTEFVASVSGDTHLRVEETFTDGYVRLRVGEAERRQAKHDIRMVEDAVIELLRNARDAGATRIFVATTRDVLTRTIVVLDNGSGIPSSMQEKIFDARVTSKLDSAHVDRWGVHGRGMALFSIKETCETAHVMSSAPGLGSSIRVDANVSQVSERKDQSTWPTTHRNEDGELQFRGPHNILRTISEFALEEQSRCKVHVGSPAEILATMKELYSDKSEGSTALLVDSQDTVPVIERAAYARNSLDLIQLGASLGLDISERTAHRILAKQIKPCVSVAAKILHTADTNTHTQVNLEADQRGLHLMREDIQAFSRVLEDDFDYIANRYYLSLSEQPRIKVSKDKITVIFNIEKHD